jgi:hypothetical protein
MSKLKLAKWRAVNHLAYSYEIAAAYALLGEKEKAAEWLKIAEKSRANNYNFAVVDARFEMIRHQIHFPYIIFH